MRVQPNLFNNFDEGELEIEVRNKKSNQKDPISTEILHNGDHVLITFLGVGIKQTRSLRETSGRVVGGQDQAE